MTSVTAFSRSVFSSRRGSRNKDDLLAAPGLPRRDQKQTSADVAPEDKIVMPDKHLQTFTQTLDGDSMKFPVDLHSPQLSSDAFGSDFGKAFLDDDQFKALGIDDNALGVAHSKHRKPSASDKIPTLAAPIEWKSNIFELDVPASSVRKSAFQPGLIPCDDQEPPLPQRSRRPSDDQSNAPEHDPYPRLRKGSAPVLTNLPVTLGEGTRQRRSLTGISQRPISPGDGRGADAPEVVPQYHDSPGAGDRSAAWEHQLRSNQLGQFPPPNRSRPDTRNGIETTTPASQQNSQARSLRSMQSTPAFKQAGTVPMSPAVPRPWMSRRPSAGSLRSLTSNINKPLPPEPPGVSLQSQTSIHGVATTRLPPTASGRKASNAQESIPPSPVGAQFLGRENRSKTAPSGQIPKVQLRSRFAKDLDAIDDAFQKSAQGQNGTNPSFTAADMAFRDPLDTIKESPRTSGQFDLSGPLQISRGPGAMVPSRRPPPTPKGRSLSPSREASRAPSVPSTPRRPTAAQGRPEGIYAPAGTAVSKALGSKMTEVKTPKTRKGELPSLSSEAYDPDAQGRSQDSRGPEPRIQETRLADVRSQDPLSRGPDSPPIHRGGGRPKLQKILGEDNMDDLPPDRNHVVRPQANLNRDVYEEPPASAAIESSQPMTRGPSLNTSAAPPFRTGTSDAQFDEIRRRLELLSPTSHSDASGSVNSPIGDSSVNHITGSADILPNESQMMHSNLPDPNAHSPGKPASKFVSPVELPADMAWGATSPPGQTFEMDAGEQAPNSIPRIIPLEPPPIPESPVRLGGLQRHSTVSSGTGRTKSLRSVKSARSARSAKARSLTSLAISEIQELYAGLPSPRTTLASRRPSITVEEIPELPPMPEVMTTEELEEKDKDNISADVAEQVLYQILRNLHEPEDLFNASLVSRGFQKTFRHHDTKLLRHALWYTSGPAWEYLEMHMPISGESGQLEYPPNLYREQYVHDMRVMANLKTLILRHCGNILSRSTFILLCAKNTTEAAPVDDAIWRIWTFCKIFGEDLERREDLEMQKRWIKGQTLMEAQVQGGHRGNYPIMQYPAFAFGNDEGLTPEELIRMGEIWLCLRRLVRGYHGQRSEAREYGIFEGVDVARSDIVREEAILDEWTIHLLSLAPGTNVEVLAPSKATADNFIKAEQLGYTNWTPPDQTFTSSGFLTGPICSVLEEWLATDPTANHLHPAFRPAGTGSASDKTVVGAPSRQTVQGFVSHIRTSQDGRDFRKLLNSARPELTVNIDSAAKHSQPQDPDTANLKSAKENKKPKFSIRLPSRSSTSANKTRSKALTPSKPNSRAPTAAPSPNDEKPSSPTFAGANGSRFDLIRNFTTRTRKNSAVEDKRPINLSANPSIPQTGRLSPSDANNPRTGSQTALSDAEFTDASPIKSSTMPVALAAERLLEQGYEPAAVDRILQDLNTNGRVNFGKAQKRMKKTRQLRERLMRLDRMG